MPFFHEFCFDDHLSLRQRRVSRRYREYIDLRPCEISKTYQSGASCDSITIPTIIPIVTYEGCTIYHRGSSAHVKLPSNCTYPGRVRQNAGTLPRLPVIHAIPPPRDATGVGRDRGRGSTHSDGIPIRRAATERRDISANAAHNGCAVSSTVIVANSEDRVARQAGPESAQYRRANLHNGRTGKLRVILTVQVVKGERWPIHPLPTAGGGGATAAVTATNFQRLRRLLFPGRDRRGQRATPKLSNVGDFRARRLREIGILFARARVEGSPLLRLRYFPSRDSDPRQGTGARF